MSPLGLRVNIYTYSSYLYINTRPFSPYRMYDQVKKEKSHILHECHKFSLHKVVLPLSDRGDQRHNTF